MLTWHRARRKREVDDLQSFTPYQEAVPGETLGSLTQNPKMSPMRMSAFDGEPDSDG